MLPPLGLAISTRYAASTTAAVPDPCQLRKFEMFPLQYETGMRSYPVDVPGRFECAPSGTVRCRDFQAISTQIT